MNKSTLTGAALTMVAVLIAISLPAQTAHKYLREGDRLYDRDQFQKAEKEYRTAADVKYGDPQALYNLANAMYQQGNWEDAAQRYEQAASGLETPVKKADAWHNLGNANMKLQKFKEAANAYENSLRLRPGDPETKSNLQMAKKKIKEQEAQQQSKQQNQPPPQEQNQNEPPPPSPQEDQNNQKQPQEQPQQPQNQPQQPQQEEQQAGKMTKEEAKRLLETAVGPEDQSNARKYRSAQQRQGKRSKKDW